MASWLVAVAMLPLQATAATDEPRRVRVGVFDNPPIVFQDDNGRIQGVAVEFLEDVAGRENWRVEYVHAPWDRLLEQLERGELDLLTGIAWSGERARKFHFTNETLINNWGVVYRQPGVEISSMVDLAGRRVALMRASIHSAVLTETLQRFGVVSEFVEVDSYEEVLEAVAGGRADAGAVNRVYSILHAGRHDVAVTPIIFNPVEVRYASSRSAGPGLVRALDQHLHRQKQDSRSSYQMALDRWLNDHRPAGAPAWMPWAVVTVALLGFVAGLFNRYLQRQVSERTRQLRHERDRAQSYLEAVQVMIVALDHRGRITLCNRRACAILGYEENKLLGRDWFETCIPEADRETTRTMFTKVVAGEIEPIRDFRNTVVTRDGQQRLIQWSSYFYNDDSGQRGLLGSGEDITDHHRAQEELRASEEKFSKAFHATPDSIMISRVSDGRILEVNEGFERITGYRAAEVVGRTSLEVGLWADPQDRARMLQMLEQDGSLRDLEVSFRRRDGNLRHCIVSGEPVQIGSAKCLLSVTRDITERKAHLAALEYQANHDTLTGLVNRQRLYARINDAIVAAARSGTPVALLLMDVNRFKEINDTLGHHAGDNMLRQIGQRLRGLFSEASSSVARLGGDEFAVLATGITDEEGALRNARAILELMRRPFELEGLNVESGVSVGIALYPAHGDNASTLMRCADVAMYVAKRGGGGFALYSLDLDQHSPRRLALSTELGSAIRGGQLVLHYQPKLELAGGSVVGVEALVRWRHPRHGMVPPGQFIPLAETSELISPLTAWVIDSALAQWQAWQRCGVRLKVAANLSTRNLLDRDLPGQIGRKLEQYGASAGVLELEITESAIMADPERALHTLGQLHRMGIGLAIDDFGTGYSSLAYLKRLPIDALKIDLSFVRNMVRSEQDALIVRSTINLAHNLGLVVVAEGVEDEVTLQALQDCGCDLVQGYFINAPRPAHEFLGWLEQHESLYRALGS